MVDTSTSRSSWEGGGVAWHSGCSQESHSFSDKRNPGRSCRHTTTYGACCAEHALVARPVTLPRTFYAVGSVRFQLPKMLPAGPIYYGRPHETLPNSEIIRSPAGDSNVNRGELLYSSKISSARCVRPDQQGYSPLSPPRVGLAGCPQGFARLSVGKSPPITIVERESRLQVLMAASALRDLANSQIDVSSTDEARGPPEPVVRIKQIDREV